MRAFMCVTPRISAALCGLTGCLRLQAERSELVTVRALSRGQYLGTGSSGGEIFDSIMSCCVLRRCKAARRGNRGALCCARRSLSAAEETWLNRAGKHHGANVLWIQESALPCSHPAPIVLRARLHEASGHVPQTLTYVGSHKSYAHEYELDQLGVDSTCRAEATDIPHLSTFDTAVCVTSVYLHQGVVCLFVCLSVNKISQIFMNVFQRNVE